MGDSDDSWAEEGAAPNTLVEQTFNSDFNNESRGGRGGGRGRGRGRGSSNGGPPTCYKCQETGHMSRECPNDDGGGDSSRGRGRGRGRGGGGGGRGCYKCGDEGHMSRDCTNEDSTDGGGGRGTGGSGCYKCGEEGHMARDCTNEDTSGGRGGGKGSGCFKCGEEGHMSRDCTSSSPDGGDKKGCFKCGEDGHFARECTNPPKEQLDADGKPRPPIYTPVETDAVDLFNLGIDAGANFSILQQQKVLVDGQGDIPKPIEQFEDCNLRKLLLENIQSCNYKNPTPIQKHALPIVLAGRDLMACAQTGSGKTAAFVLPILHYILANDCPCGAFEGCAKPTALVVTPTRELAIQIFDESRKFAYQSSIKCVVSYGGTSVQHQKNNLGKGCHLLVATPGRLKDFIERGYVDFSDLKFLVLDEADRMLDMGFAEDVKTITNHSSMPDKSSRNTLMFSATFPEKIQELAAEHLNDYLFVRVGLVGAANSDVIQSIFNVENSEKRSTLETTLKDIMAKSESNKVVVFVETKRSADFLAAYLSNDADMSCTSIHGDRFQKQREEALSQFKLGIRNILIATSVAARGLDIKGVSYVINFDLPKSIDDYVHRIGRTGRVGNRGNAISFFCESTDDAISKDLVKILGEADQEVPDWLLEISKSSSGTQTYQGGNNFGASDIRKNRSNNGVVALGGPVPNDDEEEW